MCAAVSADVCVHGCVVCTMQDCYEKFVCVENAKFGSPVVLQPGQRCVHGAGSMPYAGTILPMCADLHMCPIT